MAIQAIQQSPATSSYAAHSLLDQPTAIGDCRPEHAKDLHSEFIGKDAAKSLTRSVTSATPRRFEWTHHGVSPFTTNGIIFCANNESTRSFIDHDGVNGVLSSTTAFDVVSECGGVDRCAARARLR